MDAQLKQKWVEALRSGEYKQCRGNLKSLHGFCCLGVLAEISGLQFEDSTYANGIVTDADGYVGYRPIADLVGKKDLSPLWYRNDGANSFREHSFAEMAEYIESNL